MQGIRKERAIQMLAKLDMNIFTGKMGMFIHFLYLIKNFMTAPLLEEPLAAAAVLLNYLNGETFVSSFQPLLESLGVPHLVGTAARAMERFAEMVSKLSNISFHFAK